MQKDIFEIIEISLYKNISTEDTFIWGGFDSLEIVSTSNIYEMALNDFSLLENKWEFSNSFPENKYIIYGLNVKKNNWDEEKQEKQFQGVTLLSFDWKSFGKNKDYREKILPIVIDNIEKCKDKSQEKIVYKIYGCLSNYDLCIISYFNGIKEFISFIEDIQEISLEENIPVFSNTFSILKLNREEIEEECFLRQDSSVKVQIQLTYNCQIEWKKMLGLFKTKLFYKGFPEKDCVFSSLGEYDIVIEMPCKNLKSKWFTGAEGIFSPENPTFKKIIYQCNTRFMLVKDTKQAVEEILLDTEQNNTNFEKILKNIKELFLDTKNYSVKYMIMLLYKD